MTDEIKTFNIEKIKKITVNYDEYVNEKLQDPDYQKGWLKLSIMDYIETGDYSEFYRALEQVIKARGTVIEVPQDRSNLTEILKCKPKSAPSITTIGKILKELGFSLSVEELKSA